MTEFTKEFIEKQREQIKFISPLPWTSCSCGKCGSISNKTDPIAKATMGNWGDDYPDIRRIGGSVEGKFETFMNQITYGNIPKETGNINAQYIADACNNYPDALDEIERLQARVQELEQERRWIPVSERLPEEHEYVLLWDRYNILVGNYVFDKDKPNWCDATSLNDIYPTHWQPLPQPPEERE